MNKKSKNSTSTRDMVLSKANELINRDGMVDFRIDSLSAALAISPGNITYHFPRKDDISLSLWNECISAIGNSASGYITQLLDIKQLYLLSRFILSSLYKYRGVVCHILSDKTMISKDKEQHKVLVECINSSFESIITSGMQNGYIKSDLSPSRLLMHNKLAILSLGWSINMAVKDGIDDIANSLYATSIIASLRAILTDKGLEQLRQIEAEVELQQHND